MGDTMNERAWIVAQEISDRVSYLDPFRVTPGTLAALANDLSGQLVDIRPALRRANKVGNLDLLEACIRALSRAGKDRAGVIDRLQSAAYGVKMDAHMLAQASKDGFA